MTIKALLESMVQMTKPSSMDRSTLLYLELTQFVNIADNISNTREEVTKA